jgi:putative SOS response-associated peptidase YedK
VLASGFFEWDKSVSPSQPCYFRLKHADLFAFAGLYDVWQDPKTKKEIQSYTIITTQPNSLVGNVHDRMPVILHKEDEENWLNPDLTELEHLLPLLRPYPAEYMETWRVVGDGAKNPRNDTEELIKPLRGENGH